MEEQRERENIKVARYRRVGSMEKVSLNWNDWDLDRCDQRG